MPRGRHTKLTPETLKTILETVRVGGSDLDACNRAGIQQSTFYRWMQENKEFSEQVTRARVDGKIQRIARISKAGATDWRADAWYLERRWPEEYAQHFIIKVTPEQAAILKEYGKTPAEAFEELIKKAKAAKNG